MKMLKRIISVMLAAAALYTSAVTASAEVIYFDDDLGYTYEEPEEDEPAAEEDLDWDWDWDWDFTPPKEFSKNLKPEFTAETTSTGIKIKWDTVNNADFFRIYKYDKSKKKYVKLTDVYSYFSGYTDTDVQSKTTYSYKIRVYQTKNGKDIGSKLSDAVSVTMPIMPGDIDVYVTSKKIKLSWDKNKYADGYEVYYNKVKVTKKDKKSFFSSYGSGGSFSYHEDNEGYYKAVNGNFKKLKTTTSTSYSFNRDKNYKYYFKLRPYELKNGKKVYGEFSSVKASTGSDALFNGALGKSKSSLKVISYRSDVKEWTMSISAADKKIMDNFAAKHFKKTMSPYEKAQYLADYIHYNVNYATDADLNKISGLTCVNAVFNKKTGQCYQYNGALAEFLAYMGYDVRLVCGYRGYDKNNRWSHYWCEITLDGTKYVIDAGNQKDGLYNFVMPYECTDKYLLNQ